MDHAEAVEPADAVVPSEDRLTSLFRIHCHDAKRLAYLMTGDGALAEDIAQEAFIRAGSRLAHLRDPDRFPAYLRACVVNLVRMHFRRKEREPAAEVPQSFGQVDVDEAVDVQRGLMRLGDRQRAAIVLRYYEDLPDDEIADLLRCRRSTVRSLVARGLEALRAEVEVT